MKKQGYTRKDLEPFMQGDLYEHGYEKFKIISVNRHAAWAPIRIKWILGARHGNVDYVSPAHFRGWNEVIKLTNRNGANK